MKKRLLIFTSIILSAVLIIGVGICLYNNSFLNTKSEYELPLSFSDDFVATLKVPEQTKYIGEMGLLGVEYETTLSESEVKEFYDEYFSTLQIIYNKKNPITNSEYYTCYYDEQQRTIFSQLNIYKYNDNTRFSLCLDVCENLSESDTWTSVKPE